MRSFLRYAFSNPAMATGNDLLKNEDITLDSKYVCVHILDDGFLLLGVRLTGNQPKLG